jgi:hypothetical protein
VFGFVSFSSFKSSIFVLDESALSENAAHTRVINTDLVFIPIFALSLSLISILNASDLIIEKNA